MENNETKFVPVTRVNVETKVVKRIHETQTEKAGIVECEWDFDFTGVSESDLMELASRSVLISRRGTFKKLEKAKIHEEMNEQGRHIMVVDVAKYISENGRKPVDKVAVAKKAIGGMSNEEKQALLAQLMEETGLESVDNSEAE